MSGVHKVLHKMKGSDLSGVGREYMKLVHCQTQFAQIDVEVHHHVSGHGGREHLLLVEREREEEEEEVYLSTWI